MYSISFISCCHFITSFSRTWKVSCRKKIVSHKITTKHYKTAAQKKKRKIFIMYQKIKEIAHAYIYIKKISIGDVILWYYFIYCTYEILNIYWLKYIMLLELRKNERRREKDRVKRDDLLNLLLNLKNWDALPYQKAFFLFSCIVENRSDYFLLNWIAWGERERRKKTRLERRWGGREKKIFQLIRLNNNKYHSA